MCNKEEVDSAGKSLTNTIGEIKFDQSVLDIQYIQELSPDYKYPRSWNRAYFNAGL